MKGDAGPVSATKQQRLSEQGTAQFMTRKDSEKDSDRPHYYSQFWLDIAAGRRVIGGPKENEGEGESELESEPLEPAPLSRRAGRGADDFSTNGSGNPQARGETIAHPEVEPLPTEEFSEPETEEPDLVANSPEYTDTQHDVMDDTDIPDLDPIDEENEEENFFDDDEEEEDEEDEGWVRGRKKPTPKRPTKQPTKKPGKREPRRGF